nr:MAG TPA: hypothetical protein [Caudoviricetes sp.]
MALVVKAGASFLLQKCGTNQQVKSIYKITKI